MKGAMVIYLQTQGSRTELSEALDSLGLRNEGFADPKSFLTRLKQGNLAACLVDLSFEDSPVLLSMLKSIRTVLGAKLPLIAIVPQIDKGMEPKARAVGVSDVIQKPFDDDKLISTIATHVAAPEAEAVEVPKLIKWFFEQMSPAMAGLATSLGASGELEAQVRYYEDRLRPFRDNFISLISSLRKTEAKAELLQCIRMYGIRNTRNLVVALKLSAVTSTPLVFWNAKTGGLAGEPAHALKFANQTVDHFGEGSRNQVEAFNSGLVLDLMMVLAEFAGVRKAAVRKFIEERHIEALRHAEKCIAAGKSAESLAYDRHIITTILMREAGKAAMAIFFPDYLELRRRFEKKLIRPALQHIVELRKFGVSHNLMGALICQGAPGLDDAYKAVLFFDYPYMLKDSVDENHSYDLVRVCSVN